VSYGSTYLSSTTSLCPTCLERVPGAYEARNDAVYLTRSCPEHGTTSREVWGSRDHWEWASNFGPTNKTDASEDLTVDGDHACLAVVEITQECNLSCSYCFASSGPGGTQLPFEDVVGLLDTIRENGGTRPIQFSGGEPTVHDQLPELVEQAREMGFDHIEVNTNGINLAHREGYAERLADAGVTAIYLQFDGITRETYETIREADLLDTKHRTLHACRRADLPVILVPTVVPGTNDDEMGDIVRFALDNLDVVQSINFQPVAHFGRYETNDGRFSLDEAARRLADQIEALEPRDFLPVPCCSSYCQMSTAVMPDGDGGVLPLTGLLDLDNWDTLSGLVDEADWMELLAGTSVGHETVDITSSCCGIDVPSGGNVLPITLTGFMDADAADVNRLNNCCISVPTPDGDLVPFCAYNMTTEDGQYKLRNRHGWGGRDSVGAERAGSPIDAAVGEDNETDVERS
jgi:uncharacterized radical SAM superfamily Fe-S cluster-containing enzyme